MPPSSKLASPNAAPPAAPAPPAPPVRAADIWSRPDAWPGFLLAIDQGSSLRPFWIFSPETDKAGAPLIARDARSMGEDELEAVFDRLLRLDPSLLAAVDQDGVDWGPLAWLCRYAPKRGLGIARALLKNGADPNAVSPDGMTPLLAAALSARRPLLGASEESTIGDLGKRSSIDDLRFFDARDPAAQELRRQTGLKLGRLLLKNGALPYIEQSHMGCLHGFTPLHWAAFDGAEALADSLLPDLLAAGSMLDATSRAHGSPLHCAARWGRPAALQALVSAGADASAPDDFGSTPLHRAARSNRLEMCEALLDLGADPNALDQSGSAPLNEACRSRGHRIPKIEALLARGALPASPGARSAVLCLAEQPPLPGGSPIPMPARLLSDPFSLFSRDFALPENRSMPDAACALRVLLFAGADPHATDGRHGAIALMAKNEAPGFARSASPFWLLALHLYLLGAPCPGERPDFAAAAAADGSVRQAAHKSVNALLFLRLGEAMSAARFSEKTTIGFFETLHAAHERNALLAVTGSFAPPWAPKPPAAPDAAADARFLRRL
jgi:ankyrin repeat protein